MLKDVTTVRPLEGYRLEIGFEDGTKGTVDISQMVQFEGIFAPLKESDFFAQVHVNSDVGTICWPNGADIDPDVLYAAVTGEPIPSFEEVVITAGA